MTKELQSQLQVNGIDWLEHFEYALFGCPASFFASHAANHVGLFGQNASATNRDIPPS